MVKKILITLLICTILMTTLISALDFDNTQTILEKEGLAGYKDIEITNWLGLGEKLWSGTLDSNTKTCGNNCEAIQTITLHEKGSLVDDVIFERIYEDGSREESNIRSYQVMIKTGQQPYEVNDYEYICTNTGKININGTAETICENKLIGTHIEYNSEWTNYILGTEMDAGIYITKLIGSKRLDWSYDWIYKTQGESLDEWAVWGTVGMMDDFEGDLNASWTSTGSGNGGSPKTLLGDFYIYPIAVAGTGFLNVVYEGANLNGEYTLRLLADKATIGGGDSSASYSYVLKDESGNGVTFYTQTGNVAFTTDYYIDSKIFPSTNKLNSSKDGGLETEYDISSLVDGDEWYYSIETTESDTNLELYIEYINITDMNNLLPITLNSPVDNYYSSLNEIEFNVTGTIVGITTIANATLYGNQSGSFIIINSTIGLTGTTEEVIWDNTFIEGEFDWYVNYCDSDGVCSYSTENRTISIDTTFPSITINQPTAIENIGYYNKNETLNWSISDTNLGNIWWEYNNTNTTLYGTENTTEFILAIIPFNGTLWANDSVGNVNSTFIEWEYNIFVNNETYSEQTYGSSYETFIINLNYDPIKWELIEGNLWYNNTEYTGTDGASGDNVIFSTEIQIPTSATSLNNSFYWIIALTNGTGTYYFNITEHNQTVSPIILHLCDATYNITTLNFSLKEEGTFNFLNGSLEATFDYWGGGDGSVFQEYSFSNASENSNYAFCIAPAYAEFITDATISYYKTGYDRREYLLDDYTINNQTENITLYLSTTASTDIFTFTVRDENDDTVQDAIIRVQRWDIGTNNFYTVGTISMAADGTGIINMRLNDAWYRYQVLYGGTLYLTTEPVKESSTARTLNIDLAAANPYDQFGEIDYSLTYNEDTNITIFSYADTTGAVQVGCLRVLEMTGLGNNEVYYSCVESTSGTLSYEINDSGTYIIRAIFRLNSDYGGVEKVIDEIIRQGTPDRFVIIGKYGSVISLLLTGTAAAIGIAAGSIPLGLGLIMASLVLEGLIGWLNISSAVLYGLISIVILIALNLKRKGG